MSKKYKSLKNRINLWHIGIGGIVLNYDDGMQFIEECVENNNRILGGDIIECINNDFDVTYDNWYTIECSPTLECSAKEAADITKKYLNNYFKNKSKDRYYIRFVDENDVENIEDEEDDEDEEYDY